MWLINGAAPQVGIGTDPEPEWFPGSRGHLPAPLGDSAPLPAHPAGLEATHQDHAGVIHALVGVEYLGQLFGMSSPSLSWQWNACTKSIIAKARVIGLWGDRSSPVS